MSECLEPCDEEKDKVTQCCKKVYHESCFNKCIQLNGRCPTCRNMYTLEVEVRPSGGVSWRMFTFLFEIFLALLLVLVVVGTLLYCFVVRLK